MSVLASEIESVARARPIRVTGHVVALRGLTLLVDDLPLPTGAMVRVGGATLGEVVGFERDKAIVMPLGKTSGIRSGEAVVGEHAAPVAPVGPRLLGRVVDALGRPIDGRGPIHEAFSRPIDPTPLSPMDRERIETPVLTGVRAIDLMTPVGRGQRMGVFAGPGVGKSTLLAQIARHTSADVNVIALVGERGREVRDFLEVALGAEGLARSVVVVATGDESPVLRVRAARYASTVAEYFRELGQHVMLIMDSVTRFAHAQRQIGLSIGEPPASKGYTPSVFAELALLLERAGAVRQEAGGGSVTGMYAVLVEGDDMTEPVADAARGILDGHVILSREMARKGHYPAIDPLDSVSRVAEDVSEGQHMAARRQIVSLLAAHKHIEELLQIGAYVSGSDPVADTSIELHDAINALLRQGVDEKPDFTQARALMVRLATQGGEMIQARRQQRPTPAPQARG
ncbi:MAG: FliI/YscN family ATPase [Phycisphaerales bacterium]